MVWRPEALAVRMPHCGSVTTYPPVATSQTNFFSVATIYFYFVRLHFNLMLRAWRLAFYRRIPWLGAAVDACR